VRATVQVTRRVRATLALLALAALGAAACDGDGDTPEPVGPTVATDAETEIPSPNEPGATVPFTEAAVGDCWSAVESDGDTYVALVCTDFHDYEIHAVFRLADGAWPGEDVVADTALAGCEERFERYVGTPVDQSVLFTEPLFPDEESWAEGDRRVVCSIVDPAGASEGSAYESHL
jgi:hypothetical protein